MRTNPDNWRRLLDTPAGLMQHTIVLASWLDRGTNEELRVDRDTKIIYTRRWWTRSSVSGAGEAWFVFIG